MVFERHTNYSSPQFTVDTHTRIRSNGFVLKVITKGNDCSGETR